MKILLCPFLVYPTSGSYFNAAMFFSVLEHRVHFKISTRYPWSDEKRALKSIRKKL